MGCTASNSASRENPVSEPLDAPLSTAADTSDLTLPQDAGKHLIVELISAHGVPRLLFNDPSVRVRLLGRDGAPRGREGCTTRRANRMEGTSHVW